MNIYSYIYSYLYIYTEYEYIYWKKLNKNKYLLNLKKSNLITTQNTYNDLCKTTQWSKQELNLFGMKWEYEDMQQKNERNTKLSIQ